jgi:predicted glycogen debranching enzyme
MSQFDESVCRNLDLACRREWLETNGIGGFASSTIAGLHTRRYHGLLVAATKPPVGRMLLLSKLEETLVIDGRRTDLSCNRYPGAIHPQGHLHLKQFRQDPFPVYVYEVDGIEIEKSVLMVHGENTTVIRYLVRQFPETGAVTLELRPLIAFRDYHSTAHENGSLNPSIEIASGLVACAPYAGLPKLCLAHTSGEVHPTGDWYRNFEYLVEQERGLDYREDLFNPLMLSLDLRSNPRASIVASTEVRSASDADKMRAMEVERRRDLLGTFYSGTGASRADQGVRPTEDPFVEALVQASDQFIVRRGSESTVIAGYPWFSDWGRDTMIALPGLTLTTGRPEAARGILLAFAACVDRGMLPNRFPDASETPEYNTVDATLWFFEAIRALAAHTEDYEFIRTKLYAVLADIVSWHERGTRYGIRMDSDGLLQAGEPGVQLTWMDAKVGDWVVTPRIGKPVEIQALWYNALRVMEDLAGRFGKQADGAHYRALADRAQAAFPGLFWNESAGCLYDVVNGEARDGSIRPNQIFAVSLFHKMLPAEMAKRVVQTVERHLLTPYGLRTLAPSDPQYRGCYGGDPRSRDGAYHQGTVWPWLMGPFLTAYLEVNGRSPETRAQSAKWLEEFRRYIGDEGLGQIPEVFDGDSPQRPGGCIAQAWSVAELLRATSESRTPCEPGRAPRDSGL